MNAIATLTSIVANNTGIFGIFANPTFGITTILMQIGSEMRKMKSGTTIILSLEHSKERWCDRMQLLGFSTNHIIVNDNPLPSTEMILQTIKETPSANLLIIDYLELLETETCRALKDIAEKFSIPIVLGGHLSRDSGDYHPEKRPGLFAISPVCSPNRTMNISDFDFVALLHRKHDCYRNIGVARRYNIDNKSEFIIEINRFGDKGSLFAEWDEKARLFV